MFERPTKLDWLVYRLFVWVWNPIFTRKPWLIYGVKRAIDDWIRDYERASHTDMTYDEWLQRISE